MDGDRQEGSAGSGQQETSLGVRTDVEQGKRGLHDSGDAHYGTFDQSVAMEDDGRHSNGKQTQSTLNVKEGASAADGQLKTTYVFVYISHFLSAWGDRMWSFGVGLFLLGIASENLQLPATYGLASGLAVFILGALIGDWVDSTARLRAAQLSLVLQNLFVVICAGGVYAYLFLESQIKEIEGSWAVPLCHAGIIAVAVLSDLASVARVIAVERDWIVKICQTDTDMLATKRDVRMEEDRETDNSKSREKPPQQQTAQPLPETSFSESRDADAEQRKKLSTSQDGSEASSVASESTALLGGDAGKNQAGNGPPVKKAKGGCCGRLLYQILTLRRGWRTYMRLQCGTGRPALACLYMTVLGLTTSPQASSESIVGVLMGVSAVFGMIGTFHLPRHEAPGGAGSDRYHRLVVSGLACLSLCVVSVWMPGSPFDPFYLSRSPDTVNASTLLPASVTPRVCACVGTAATPPSRPTRPLAGHEAGKTTSQSPLLMAGIVLARFGLWMADLSITQLFLEEVIETERGIVNGVQSSLNKMMDVLKFLLVVAVPDTETFGFLIIISFAFVSLGWLLYAIFVRKARGHFFHVPKCTNNNNYEKI
ncbi:hypothetical protein BaRGS_00000120 [Batillaria attramentaria]|uniref:Solute carrier family 40 member n=1 Tax=Batillaria attramentaria TaxID=370345 RepID=A0ABD0MB93_9CAEN